MNGNDCCLCLTSNTINTASVTMHRWATVSECGSEQGRDYNEIVLVSGW